MSKVLFTATPFHGHVSPMLALAADLTRRGHEVLFYTGARFQEKVEATGARFVAYAPELDYDDRDLGASFPQRAGLPQLESMAFDLMHVFGDPAPAHDRRIQELLAEFPASVVFTEPTSLAVLATPLRAPRGERPLVVTLGIAPPSSESVDLPPFGPALPPATNEAMREQYAAMRGGMRQMMAEPQRHLEGVFEQMGVTLPDFFLNAMDRVPDHRFHLTVPAFEYPRSDAPEGFRFIGALPADSGTDYELPDWWDRLSDGRPVVVVTQGTLANRDLTQLVVPTVEGLAGLDVTVVAATVRADGPDVVREALGGTVPDNVILADYVPFERIFPLSSVLVTNAGYGGVQTALRHGLPLVVGGDTEEKPEVAARVAWSGTGVDLRTGRPEAAAVRKGVEEVLGGASYREKAEEIQAAYQHYDPLVAVAEFVEQHG
ncbi:hypothetical protein KUM39_25045 [Streptomyces sp. J2-1]|uniref:glycosyltransferase n=1 Tax=Streptomyces corallincola TaxID=2851888 RepID=UPI001C37EFE2|nr:nucleotide disphospho-sugar-binding domain-containing protein [Streptomyces corallincola]MBV2357591.1 hypothetical protein [Streptomyces corallincola]